MRNSVSFRSSLSSTTASPRLPDAGLRLAAALALAVLAGGCASPGTGGAAAPATPASGAVAAAAPASGAASAAAGAHAVAPKSTLDRVITFFAPYRADIIQGNVVTAEQIARVKPGMTRVQVRDVLGSPLVADPFHADRWDYVFTMQRQGIDPVRRAFTVRFKDDAVLAVDAPDLPTEKQFVADISTRPLPKSEPKLELTAEEKAALPVPPPVAAAPARAASSGSGPTRAYPPLEAQ